MIREKSFPSKVKLRKAVMFPKRRNVWHRLSFLFCIILSGLFGCTYSYRIFVPNTLSLSNDLRVVWDGEEVSHMNFIRYHKETKNNEFLFEVDVKDFHRRKKRITELSFFGDEPFSKAVINAGERDEGIDYKVWADSDMTFTNRKISKEENRHYIQLIKDFCQIQRGLKVDYPLKEFPESSFECEYINDDGSIFSPEQYFDLFKGLKMKEGTRLIYICVNAGTDLSFPILLSIDKNGNFRMDRYHFDTYRNRNIFFSDILADKSADSYLGLVLLKYYSNQFHSKSSSYLLTSYKDLIELNESTPHLELGRFITWSSRFEKYKPEVIAYDNYVVVRLTEVHPKTGVERVFIKIPDNDSYDYEKRIEK